MNLIANCYFELKEYGKYLFWINKVLHISSNDKESVAHKKIIGKIIERKRTSNKEG